MAVKLQLWRSLLKMLKEHCTLFWSCTLHDDMRVTWLALCAHAAGSTFIQRQTTAWLTKTAERMQWHHSSTQWPDVQVAVMGSHSWQLTWNLDTISKCFFMSVPSTWFTDRNLVAARCSAFVASICRSPGNLMQQQRNCMCRTGRPYRNSQDRLLWKDKTCPAHTCLIVSWKAMLLLLLLLLLLRYDYYYYYCCCCYYYYLL